MASQAFQRTDSVVLHELVEPTNSTKIVEMMQIERAHNKRKMEEAGITLNEEHLKKRRKKAPKTKSADNDGDICAIWFKNWAKEDVLDLAEQLQEVQKKSSETRSAESPALEVKFMEKSRISIKLSDEERKMINKARREERKSEPEKEEDEEEKKKKKELLKLKAQEPETKASKEVSTKSKSAAYKMLKEQYPELYKKLREEAKKTVDKNKIFEKHGAKIEEGRRKRRKTLAIAQ